MRKMHYNRNFDNALIFHLSCVEISAKYFMISKFVIYKQVLTNVSIGNEQESKEGEYT